MEGISRLTASAWWELMVDGVICQTITLQCGITMAVFNNHITMHGQHGSV